MRPSIELKINLKTISFMKTSFIIFLLFSSACFVFGQNQEIEAEIRRLEQVEVKAILEKDSITLLKLWDKDYVVNAPDNKINFAGKTTLDRPVLTRSRSSLIRNTEAIIIQDHTVFSMGNETVVPTDPSQPVVKRRYTNIWMKKEGMWKLVARHANIICP